MKIKIIEKEEKILRFKQLTNGDLFSFKYKTVNNSIEDILLRIEHGYVNLSDYSFVSDDDFSDSTTCDTEIIKHELIEFTVKRG